MGASNLHPTKQPKNSTRVYQSFTVSTLLFFLQARSLFSTIFLIFLQFLQPCLEFSKRPNPYFRNSCFSPPLSAACRPLRRDASRAVRAVQPVPAGAGDQGEQPEGRPPGGRRGGEDTQGESVRTIQLLMYSMSMKKKKSTCLWHNNHLENIKQA